MDSLKMGNYWQFYVTLVMNLMQQNFLYVDAKHKFYDSLVWKTEKHLLNFCFKWLVQLWYSLLQVLFC